MGKNGAISEIVCPEADESRKRSRSFLFVLLYEGVTSKRVSVRHMRTDPGSGEDRRLGEYEAGSPQESAGDSTVSLNYKLSSVDRTDSQPLPRPWRFDLDPFASEVTQRSGTLERAGVGGLAGLNRFVACRGFSTISSQLAGAIGIKGWISCIP